MIRAAQLGVGGLPDLAHAAFTKQISDVVVAEAGAGGQRHELSDPEEFYAQAVAGASFQYCVPPLGCQRV